MPRDEIILKGEIDAAAAAKAATTARDAAAQAATKTAGAASQATRVTIDQAYFTALLDAGKSSVEHSRSAAELVQKAAAAIGTLYAGVLGLTFSVSGRQLPIQGVIPAFFLGLAIALSTAYIAFITHPSQVALEPISTSPPERMKAHLRNFFTLTNSIVERRSSWLRASVVALGIGVAALPAPYINLGATRPTSTTQQSASATPTPPPVPGWPSPPAVANEAGATLNSILYKAQVDEVATNRKRVQTAAAEVPVKTEDGLAWAALTGAGLVAVGVVVLWRRLTEGSPESAATRSRTSSSGR